MTSQTMLPTEIDNLRERVTQLENQLARQEQTVLTLQENESRLHSVLDNLTDALYRRNLCTDRYDYLSPVIEQLTGWTVEEMNQADIETVLARIHPDDLSLVQREIERTRRLCQEVGRATGGLEYRFRTKTGDYCWLGDYLTMIAGDDGQPLYLLGVVRDITKRKQAEEAQQESLAKLEYLFEILPVGISVLNHQRQVVKQNPALENIVGISAEGLALGDYRQRHYIRPDGTPMPTSEFASARVIRGEPDALNVEMGIIKEDDTVVWTRVSAVAVPFSDWNVVIVTQDITAKKQAEQALQASQQNLAALIENTDASIWSVDRQYRMMVGNELYHRNVSAAIGRSLAPGESVLSLNLSPAALDEWRGYYDRALEGETFSVETSTRFTVEVRTIEYRFNPIRTSEGQITGVTVFGRDISERKRAEKELYHTLEELRRSNVELEQFAYVASHDLQEPLRAVTGMMQLLQQKYRGRLDEVADEYIGLAVEAANRMQSLIKDLLAYSRVGRRGKPFESVSASRCLQQALRNLEVSISESRATITYDDLPSVKADSTQLPQLFQNLIGNALKFRGDQAPKIHISAREVEKAWQFSVRDNGIGIEPQYFERIFLIFQRLHLREEYPGTGIGLTLCQKIVERHEGKIWVESQPGQGSTFYFTLPPSQN